uniref:Uncharacterized protein n=1 Tax=Tanacetum cinerariifolium TaxID=118510 RepID=A0A6L2L6L1_TANCI|nr:hypothetical protein [Tanacetum cinerariifolium]
MDDNLIAKESTNNSTLSEQHNKCSRSGNENKSSNNESSSAGNNADADIRPSNDNDTIREVNHDMFENMVVHGIQNHVQPESIPDTYVESIGRMMKIIDRLSLDSRYGKPKN